MPIDDKLIIRQPEEKEYGKFKDLMHYCFMRENPENGEFFFNKEFKKENCLVAITQDKLAATLQIRPYQVNWYGQTVKMGGISAVATFPEYRRKGYVSQLLLKSLRMMKENGQIISMLAPFRYSFYRHYGWETGFIKQSITIKMEDLTFFPAPRLEYTFRELTAEDWEILNKIYLPFARCYNGMGIRDEYLWSRKFDWIQFLKQHLYGAFSPDGELRGYVYFEFQEKKLQINEFIYADRDARLALLQFVYWHNPQTDKIFLVSMPQDDPMLLELNDPRREHEVWTGMMVRIVDVAALLEMTRPPEDYSADFTIKIDDARAPWNDGIFRVTIHKGKVNAQLVEQPTSDVECFIGAFSQLATGFQTTAQLAERDMINIHNQEACGHLDVLFPAKPNYLQEAF